MPVRTADYYRDAIARSGMDIYSPIDPEDQDYFIPTSVLEELLDRGLRGLNLDGLAPRTRSKTVKQEACRALGYPVPSTFSKCQPRFGGQDLDIYNQQALNLQIWNEPINPTRRYALVRIGADGVVNRVRVVHGDVLIPLDTTGRLTTKYQAQLLLPSPPHNLLSRNDTAPIQQCLSDYRLRHKFSLDMRESPTDQPEPYKLLPIDEVFRRLSPLVGMTFPDAGRLQDRARGAELHRLVCQALGYSNYQDNGQFPDVRHQLLEVKLQTSPTIDLGLVLPESVAAVRGVKPMGRIQPRHCDTRYAIFAADIANGQVRLTHLFVVLGADFFSHFRQFGGLVQNQKIQIPLPRSLFGG